MMLGKAEGVTEYQLKGERRKVAAFASMSVENASWIVVVNAPLDEVTAFVQEDFKKTLLILGILTSVLGLAFFSAYRNYRQKVDGEMAERRLRDQQKLMEERETRDYLESLIKYANAPVIVWKPDFTISQFNQAFEKLTGRTASEVIGKHLSILFPEETREPSLQEILRTPEGEYWESVEIPILRTDGSVRLALWNSANIYSRDGKTLVATIAQGQDITERRRAEAELLTAHAKMAFLINSISSILIAVSDDDRIVFWNTEAEKQFGIPEKEVLGKPINASGIQWDLDQIMDGIVRCRKENNPVGLDNVCLLYTSPSPRDS